MTEERLDGPNVGARGQRARGGAVAKIIGSEVLYARARLHQAQHLVDGDDRLAEAAPGEDIFAALHAWRRGQNFNGRVRKVDFSLAGFADNGHLAPWDIDPRPC